MKAGAANTAPRRSGRPSKQETARIRDNILDIAAGFFFSEGYGATSIEAIARRAGISKRTLYHRFKDKAEVFRAVVHRVIDRMRPVDPGPMFEGKSTEDVLKLVGQYILRVTLMPEGLALHRVIIAEAARFPELAMIIHEEGSRKEAIQRIAARLRQDVPSATPEMACFAAEQFLQMVIATPQRRGLGLGTPMNPEEVDHWVQKTVKLFLQGWGR